MSDVVVIAHDAEGISAAFRATIGTDRSTAVSAFGHGRLATRHTDVAVTGDIFNLAELAHGYAAFANVPTHRTVLEDGRGTSHTPDAQPLWAQSS